MTLPHLNRHRAIAERLEDLASRLDAGLTPAGQPGEPIVTGLRGEFTLAGWEWAALAAGEAAGRLPVVLRRVAAARRDRDVLQRELWGSLAYPGLVLCMCAGVGVLALGMAQPPRAWFWLSGGLALAIGILVVAAVRWLRSPLSDGDRVPWLGRLSRHAGEVPYLVALQALYGAGVALRGAHPQASPAAAVPWVRARLFAAGAALDAGEPLAEALGRQRALTEESLTLVRDGEATGQLEDALGRAIVRRRAEYARRVRHVARGIGIAAYVYAAASVLWIALSFYGGYYSRLR
jgi:type II secretory pathway component PulF